jgi:hypothetical protein
VRVIPDRGELARCLLGAGRKFSPERDAVAELVAERAAERAKCGSREKLDAALASLPDVEPDEEDKL